MVNQTTFQFKEALATKTQTQTQTPTNTATTTVSLPKGYIEITGPSKLNNNNPKSKELGEMESEQKLPPGQVMYSVIDALEKKWRAYEKAYNKMNGDNVYAEKFRWAQVEPLTSSSFDTDWVSTIATTAYETEPTTSELETKEGDDEVEGINEGLKTPYFST
jgi:hypothetical protein